MLTTSGDAVPNKSGVCRPDETLCVCVINGDLIVNDLDELIQKAKKLLLPVSRLVPPNGFARDKIQPSKSEPGLMTMMHLSKDEKGKTQEGFWLNFKLMNFNRLNPQKTTLPSGIAPLRRGSGHGTDHPLDGN